MTAPTKTHTAVAIKRQGRPGSLLIILFMAWLLWSGVWTNYLAPSPTVRAVLRLTPFHSVTAVLVSWSENSVTVRGTMVKRRCEIVSMSAYVTGPEGYQELVKLDRSAEDKRRAAGKPLINGEMIDRPPSEIPQAWGPWTITDPTPESPAVGWSVHTVHDCPEGRQTNVFISGDWPAGRG